MSRRPLPDIEETPLESGVGPTAVGPAEQQPAGPPAQPAPERGLVHVPDQPEAAVTTAPPTAPEREAVPAAGPTSPAAGRPRAQDLVTRRMHIEREQLNGMVPRVLELRRRMRLYELDTNMQMRDQMAVALDTWLSMQGY